MYRDGDGVPDKNNSTSLEAMRHASWDIAMSGGYFVTSFGTTYWMMAEPGRQYLVYSRGVTTNLGIELEAEGPHVYRVEHFNPRTGEMGRIDESHLVKDSFAWTPPDDSDWILLMTRRIP